MKIENASFRDQDGFVYYENNQIYRKVNSSYFENYQFLYRSGLYQSLTNKKWLVSHSETEKNDAYLIIQPEIIPFISYPYEWAFYQLKRAALLTLDIQLEALQKGMTLKDASAFNVQFLNGKPIFIDTLSFEIYQTNRPWVAYKQFCEHFLCPLTLQVYGINELNHLQSNFIDGIPLGLTSKILPFKSKLHLGIYSHIHLNAKFEKKYSNVKFIDIDKMHLSLDKQIKIIKHLRNIISNFSLPKSKTNWTDYYNEYSYNSENIIEKKAFVENKLNQIVPNTVLDTGSNTGLFSEIASKHCKQVISIDFDSSVIHNQCKINQKKELFNILPLVVNLITPSPAIGWENTERKSFIERLDKSSTALCLALMHHLTLSNNISFEMIAKFYYQISENLIIEFVPKNDPQSHRLLVTKKDVFPNYDLNSFKNIFEQYFDIIDQKPLKGSERIMFHMKRKVNAKIS